MIRKVLILGLITLMAVPLTACGRKGNPEEPDNPVYPRIYPYTPMPESAKKKSEPPTSSRDFQPPQPRITVPPTNIKPPAAESGQTQ